MSDQLYGHFAEAPDTQLSTFHADGFAAPVAGVVYRAGRLARGLPLGALGTGYVELTGSGRLGDTTIFNHFPSAYTAEPPHRIGMPFVAVQAEGRTWVLALPPVEGDGPDELGSAQYADEIGYWGHYPFAELSYEFDGPIEVTLRAWCPFVPGDEAASNVPCAVLDLTTRNRTSRPVDVRIGIAFPGFPVEPGATYGRHPLEGPAQGVVTTAPRHGTLFGYALGVEGVEGVTVGAALGQPGAPWSALGDEDLPKPSSDSAGTTVASTLGLEGGEGRTVRGLLGWYYPSFQIGGAVFPYEHMYARRFSGPASVADHLASTGNELLDRTLGWQRAIYGQDLPGWLRDGLINGLYCLAKNSWWNPGDLADDPWGENGVFTVNETFRDCPVTETVPCRFFGHFPLLMLFPSLEETTLRALAHYQLKSGEIPFALSFGSGLYDPRYHCVHPFNSSMFVQLLYRYYLRTGKKRLLEKLFDAVKDAIAFAHSLDTDDDGLVNEHPHNLSGTLWPANNYHDAYPWHGTSIWGAGLWLATLGAAEQIARILGDDQYAASCESWRRTGEQALESKLWRGDRYLLYNDPVNGDVLDASLLNQLIGEWCARCVGLPNVFPEDRAERAIEIVLEGNVAGGAVAPIDTVTPDGRPYAGTPSEDEGEIQWSTCMVSEAFCFAMTLLWRGRIAEGLQIVERIWSAHAIAHRTPFDQYYMIDPQTGAPVWGNDYYSNMILWAVPMALAQQGLSEYASSGVVAECLAASAQRLGGEATH